jgi:hypothetical protein
LCCARRYLQRSAVASQLSNAVSISGTIGTISASNRPAKSDRSYLVRGPGTSHEAQFFDQFGQRNVVQHRCHGVANLLHNEASLAAVFVHALGTSAVSRFADAGQRRERTVNRPNDRSNGDRCGWKRQIISAAFAFAAVHQPGMTRLGKNSFEELAGDGLLASDNRGADKSTIVFPRQAVKRAECIPAFPRKRPHKTQSP